MGSPRSTLRAIHGVTTEHAQADGWPLADVLSEIRDWLMGYWSDDVPVVACNMSYDATVLNQELARCGLTPVTYTETGTWVLDPLVCDRAVDKYRKGRRTLTHLCEYYGVPLGVAHTSSVDALAAVRVMRRIAQRYPEVGGVGLRQLYRWQVISHFQWAGGYQDYLRSQGDPDAVVDPSWPVRLPALAQDLVSR